MANSLNWRGELEFNTGDTLRVHQTISEGDKTRTQIFEGIVTRIRGHQGLKTFTVRKIGANNIGVEKIFPENTPTIIKIELKKRGKVRRAVLSYLKKRVGRKATKIKDVFVKAQSKEIVSDSVPVTKKVEAEKNDEDVAKNKVAKRPKTEKIKKVKKGPKKIQRKERIFVR
jgi:large subunit ribosomal protein L19